MIRGRCHKQRVKMIPCLHLYCTSALISNHNFYSPHKYTPDCFFSLFYYMAVENKRQNSVERQQVWLTGAQLVVCLLHILRDNYPFSTSLNKRSRFTCSSPGLKWILKIETHGKAIQEASAEHHDQIGKKSVLMCKFTQERFRCWYCSIQTLGKFIALQSRAQPINGLL